MTDKATRLRELRDDFRALPLISLRVVLLFRRWAKLCGHFQAVDAVDSFMQFVEGDDEA